MSFSQARSSCADGHAFDGGASVAAAPLSLYYWLNQPLTFKRFRYLDVSGNVHFPGHAFNPVQVLRFGAMIDRFLFPSSFSPISAAEGGSLLRFLSTHTRSRNGNSVSSYAAAAHRLRRVVCALLSTVHPVLLCMYTRWLRLQEQTRTPSDIAANAATRSQLHKSSFPPLTPSSVSSPVALIPPFSSFSSSSPRMRSTSACTSPEYSPRQHRIVACSETNSRSHSNAGSISAGLPLAGADVPSVAGASNCSERLALAIEGGAMRGCVTAGMAAALHHMGYADVFDAVYGSSAGSLIGAYFLSRQLPYEGAQIYYDWLPYMGKKFLDMKRLGKGLGLGFLLDADILGFLRKKTGSPLINLDVLLHDVVQRRQPLDWEKFKRQDQQQPLKVIASGLHSQNAVILESAAGNFNSFSTFLNCLRASMLMPGLAGPVVHVHVLSRSNSTTNICDSSTRTDNNSASGSDRVGSGFMSSAFHGSATEKTASVTLPPRRPSSSIVAATPAVDDAASGLPNYFSRVAVPSTTRHALKSFPATDIASSADNMNPSSSVTGAEPSSASLPGTEVSVFSPAVFEPSPSASPTAPAPPCLSFSSSTAASHVSEPLADALLYEPIPYRSALLQGYNRVLVLRSRPDGKRVGRLSGLEAAIENRVVSRFFGETHLRHVYDYVKQRRHRIRYMDDMLLLNEASNSRKLLRVIQDDLESQHQEEEKEHEQKVPEKHQQKDEQQVLEGYAFAVSLTSNCAEVAKTSLKRSKILQGIRDGFARLYDVLVPEPAKRGRGMEEALKIFPEDLPRVTDTLLAAGGGAAAVAERLPPAYDDSAERQQIEAGVLGQYVLQAALAEDPRLLSCSSPIIFGSPSRRFYVRGVSDAAAAAATPCSSVTRANGSINLCEAKTEQQFHQGM